MHEGSILVKTTAVALSVCVFTGLGALRALSPPVEVCNGDFITICRPIEFSPLVLFLLAAGSILTFLLFAKLSGHLKPVISGRSQANIQE